MIYIHVINQKGKGVKSPADFKIKLLFGATYTIIKGMKTVYNSSNNKQLTNNSQHSICRHKKQHLFFPLIYLILY